eukprot:5841883-Amphidinium_carterae.1
MSPSVAVIAEHWTVLKKVLQDAPYTILMHTHAHTQTCRKVHEDLQLFVDSVPTEQPSLLWIQWHGEQAPGRRAQVRTLR